MTEFRPTRFEILPLIVKNLLIINGLVFLAQQVIPEGWMNDTLGLHTFQSIYFKPWQFITHLFMHAGFGHLLSNMIALWVFGSVLESLWGPKRFLTFYLICGLGAALCHMVALYFNAESFLQELATENLPAHAEAMYLARNIHFPVTMGASGAVFGCLAAFGYLMPNTYIYIYFLFPIKAKYLVIGYGLFELLALFRNSPGDNVAHLAHLGGAVVGLILVYFWNKNNRRQFY